MATSDDAQHGRYRRSNVIDVTDSTEIWISHATLELKLRDLEDAGGASKYEDVIPWIVSASLMVVSAIPLYITSQEYWARALAVVVGACALIPITLAVQGWRKARSDKEKRGVTADSVLADILQNKNN